MLIKYVHASAPPEVRVCTTEKTYRNCIGIIRGLGGDLSQATWDKNELLRFKSDLKQGIILSYEEVSA